MLYLLHFTFLVLNVIYIIVYDVFVILDVTSMKLYVLFAILYLMLDFKIVFSRRAPK